MNGMEWNGFEHVHPIPCGKCMVIESNGECSSFQCIFKIQLPNSIHCYFRIHFNPLANHIISLRFYARRFPFHLVHYIFNMFFERVQYSLYPSRVIQKCKEKYPAETARKNLIAFCLIIINTWRHFRHALCMLEQKWPNFSIPHSVTSISNRNIKVSPTKKNHKYSQLVWLRFR